MTNTKKYEKSIENDINQEIIIKPIYDVCDSNIILQRYFEKKIKDSFMEFKKGHTRKYLKYMFDKKIFLTDIRNQRRVIHDLFKQNSCRVYLACKFNSLSFIGEHKEIGKIEIDNIRNWNNEVLTENKTIIIKSWLDICCIFEKDCLREDYVVEILNNVKKMQQFSKIIKIGADSNMISLSDGELSPVLIKVTDKCSGKSYELGKIIFNKYSNCNFINTNICCTYKATQNNGISKYELNKIVDSIEKDLDKLNQEQAEDLQDTLSMVVEEFKTGTPRAVRLKKCLTLLAPIMTVSNGIPTLAENLQKLCEYILPFIN